MGPGALYAGCTVRTEPPKSTTLVVSTAIDLVTRLYVAAHTDQGDFEQLPENGVGLVAEVARDVLGRYFGADFSLGMSLVITSAARDWATAGDLVDGISALPATELAAHLLASTTLEQKDRDATADLVGSALADRGRAAEAARGIVRRNAYRRSDVEYVLEDPERAQRDLVGLLRAATAGFSDEASASERLQARTTEIAARIDRRGREQALLESTGGWTVQSEAQGLVLVPTLTLGPLVITRLLPDGRYVVAFGPDRERTLSVPDMAAVARALASDQRIEILRQISVEPASGQTLAKTLDLTQATVHYHTAMLRSCGLITSTRSAHSVLHAVDESRLTAALTGIARTVLRNEAIHLTR